MGHQNMKNVVFCEREQQVHYVFPSEDSVPIYISTPACQSRPPVVIFFFLNYYNTMQLLVTLKSIGPYLWIWASCILHPFSLIYFFSKKDCQSSRNNVLFAMTQKTMPEDEQQYTSGMTQKTTQKTRNNVLYLL
jgi:hypothetical protein